jgi:mannose-6-phosphate isomerase-like protein (cupin superfamily)
MKNKKVIFPKKIKIGKRNWGSEELIALISKKISLKLIKIKKGKKGGLQYHHKKEECGYILSGKLLIRYDDGFGKLKQKIIKKGDTFYFPKGSVHQEEAISDVQIIEASTPYFNDRVRVEEKYGLSSNGGLPSTKLKDVLLK